MLSLAGMAYGATIHVSTTGTDSGSCGTTGAPCRNPAFAVDKAASGDVIRVAGGTYVHPFVQTSCSPVPVPSVICVFDKSLTIEGGYAGATWVFDPGTNPTVLNGQNAFRGVNVFSSVNPPIRLTMTTITIQNGRAGPTNDPSPFGGGMEVVSAAVTLNSVTFLNNQAIGGSTGGGAGGSAAGSGLSIRSTLSGAVSFLSNVTFQGNISTGGQGPSRGGVAFGALFVFASTAVVDNSRFINNAAQGGSSAGAGESGGLRADALGGGASVEAGGNLTLTRVTVTGNTVTGGAASQFGGGAFGAGVFAEDATTTITDSLIQSNVAQGAAAPSGNGGFVAGGGVLFLNTNGRIDRTRIIANRATGGNSAAGQPAGTGGGGGLHLWRANPSVVLPNLQVTNTVIADNRVELGTGTNSGGGGGGVQVQGLTADLTHVTLARNQFGPGLVVGQGMVVVGAPGVPATSTANLNYSVVADHVATTGGSTALVVTQDSALNLNNGAFTGNTNDTNANGTPLPPGSITGLASMTTVASAGFVSPGAPHHDYHLNTGSPLRNAANGSTMGVDVDATVRVDGRPDIGADEYKTVKLGDFNGDGNVDLLWRHSSGDVAIWLMNGATVLSSVVIGNVTLDWTIVGVGDFNADGRSDLLWRHASGTLSLWLMNGVAIAATLFVGAVGTDWGVAGVADFNGDGRADILWRHASGTVAVWLMNGANLIGSGVPGTVGTDWSIAGVGRFNGDANADILWRHTSGTIALWFLSGASVIGSGALNSGADWAIAGVADFNGDGMADIMRRHTSGSVSIWLMNGATIATAGSPGTVASDWGIANAGDFNGASARADILWQHVSGLMYVWFLNGTAIVSTGSPGTVGGGWQLK